MATTGSIAGEGEGYRLPDASRPGRVRLRVADLERSLGFYRDVLGLRVREERDGDLALGVGGEPLVVLRERPGAVPAGRRSTGLYHYALLVPGRRELARVLYRLGERRWRLQGASDHLVSEALYLADPDGNGIEIYRDRPRSEWGWRGDQVEMATAPLDLESLLREADPGEAWTGMPEGTAVGHVHLHVSRLERAWEFYHEGLGLGVTNDRYPGALFLSAGGYHHHLGANVWAGVDAPPTPPDMAGLIDWEVVLPDAGALEGLEARLRGRGVEVEREGGGLRLADLDGVGLRVRSE